jgi:hypothetical protein
MGSRSLSHYPNLYRDFPIIKQIITISLETIEIVIALPPLDIIEDPLVVA